MEPDTDSLAHGRDPLFACPRGQECSTCSKTFKVDARTHTGNRHYVHDKGERGGSMSVDFKRGTLQNNGVTQSSKYNRIEMDRGAIDWHSHPGSCLNDNMCALGLPSPMDLVNIIKGSLYGTRAHMVYAKEGTYVVQLSRETMSRLQADRRSIRTYLRDIDRTFDALHKMFLKHSEQSYRQYRQVWLETASQKGLVVHFFPGDTVPEIFFEYGCSFNDSPKPVVAKINIPDHLENMVLTKTRLRKSRPGYRAPRASTYRASRGRRRRRPGRYVLCRRKKGKKMRRT